MCLLWWSLASDYPQPCSSVWSIRQRHTFGLALSPLFLLFAVWTKYWVFAIFAYLSLLPHVGWQWLSAGFSRWRMVLLVLSMSVWLAAITNVDFPRLALALPLAIYGLVVPWRQLDWPQRMLWILLPAALWALTRVDLINAYTTSGEGGRFGSGYAAIGANKWLRNLVNVPAVVVVGIGLPATLFIGLGVKKMLGDVERARLWLCLLPILAFLLFMAFLAPVTYYRHYLPLIPAACLLAAVGLHATSLGRRSWFVALFMLWPALLALDLVSDYHRDPRLALRPWFAEHPQAAVFTSFYVSPPPGTRTALFRPEFAQGDGATLKQADYLILSENWYDTAYANELNGPRVNDLEKLIKTTPEYTRFYRQALAGQHPLLLPSAEMNLRHFMPELMLHRHWYGSFQLFVGDLRIFRVSK